MPVCGRRTVSQPALHSNVSQFGTSYTKYFNSSVRQEHARAFVTAMHISRSSYISCVSFAEQCKLFSYLECRLRRHCETLHLAGYRRNDTQYFSRGLPIDLGRHTETTNWSAETGLSPHSNNYPNFQSFTPTTSAPKKLNVKDTSVPTVSVPHSSTMIPYEYTPFKA